MPFVSDAQRKHFFANKGGDSGEVAIFQKMYNDANQAIKDRHYGDGQAYEHEKDALFNREYAHEWLADRGHKVAMPQTSESQKIEWAAWRGDFGKK